MWLLIRRLLLAVTLAGAAPAFAQETERPNDIDRILSQMRTDRAMEQYQDTCDMPAAGAREQIVLLSASGSRRASNVTLMRQQDVYGVGDIVIEPGSAPIYLVLVSETSAIWRFSGATRRLRSLVLISWAPNGFVGAQPRAFDALTMSNCFTTFGGPEMASTRTAIGIVTHELGRVPDVVAYQQNLEISIPRGVQAPPVDVEVGDWPAPPEPPAGFDPETWRAGPMHVAELAMLDPADVRVLGAQATAYDVMPGWMGMSQLVARGALQFLPYANDGWMNFRVLQPHVRLPPNVSFRDYTIRLYLPAGASPPEGDLTGVCIVDEATGQWLGPVSEFCAERHAWMASNIERNERARRAQQN